ncbi:GNAT family N-acetyltransferase [Saccharothrix variisporea]|uniref:Acetyltransferase (GNAT) family protein n=1 Tax=Saccharothrix variisporea TaxID=543527 RepID=A0A495XC45_9PSEU|nr:GNAT family N-acetyltransferase [Saccharothrix variisporea]RKT70414.1 acetyltransferase (GNAT) family protein [Saccharothrix variisporea]
MSIEVGSFDPHTAPESDLREYHRIRVAEGDPDDLDYERLVTRMRHPMPGLGPAEFRLVRVAGEVVGVVYTRYPEAPNDHMALCEVVVHPDHRRRGIGTQVLRTLLPDFRARGRRTVEAWLVVEDSPGDRWAKWLGFRTARSIARLGLDFADADRSLWHVDPPAGYELVRWTGTTPDDLVESTARARGAIHDAPTGDTEFREPEWTAQRVRETEAEYRDGGVEQRVVAAVRDGEVVGLTEVIRLPSRPDRFYQGYTAVLGAHRGRRIGLWLKGDMLRWLAEDPTAARITTATESENHHMIRVNRELGWHDLPTDLVLAHDVAALAERLGG